jgi:hypothetical protein
LALLFVVGAVPAAKNFIVGQGGAGSIGE